MKFLSLFALVAAAGVSPAAAASLSDYTSVTTYAIDTNEASAVTYSRTTDKLYIIGDEGRELTEYSKTGQLIGGTALGGFSDTEGVAYMGTDGSGRGLFMIADERIQHASLITYTNYPSPTNETHANYTPGYSFGPSVGNIGLEGVSYDHLTNTLWGVKETNAQAIYRMDLNEGAGNALTNPFDPASLGLLDLSDIYLLSNSLAFAGTDREWNLLIISQESQKILEVTRTGQVVSMLDLSQLALPKKDTIEGITMDDAGVLYLVAEGGSKSLPSHLYVLNAVPEPSTYALLGLGAIVAAISVLRRRTAA